MEPEANQFPSELHCSMQSFILSHQDRHTDDVPRVVGATWVEAVSASASTGIARGHTKPEVFKASKAMAASKPDTNATVGSSSFVLFGPVVASFEGARIVNVKSVASRHLQSEVKAVRDALPLPAELRERACACRGAIGPTPAGNGDPKLFTGGRVTVCTQGQGTIHVHTPSQHYLARVKAGDYVFLPAAAHGESSVYTTQSDRSNCTRSRSFCRCQAVTPN